MKNIFIVLFLLLTSIIYAQSNKSKNYGKIVYERIVNFDNNPKKTTFNLFFNPNFSVFYESNFKKNEGATLKPSSDDEFDLSFDVKFSGSKYIVLTDFKKDSIQSQVSLFNKGKQRTYIVEEKINKIKWNIINDYKTISNIRVQKAIGEFRGRKYTVWFANSIPVKYGPWKLNGLPGLILKAVDSKNEVMFNATILKVPFIINTETKETYKFNNAVKRIKLNEYVLLKQQQIEEVKKLFNSKLPRGAKMEMTNPKLNDIELEY